MKQLMLQLHFLLDHNSPSHSTGVRTSFLTEENKLSMLWTEHPFQTQDNIVAVHREDSRQLGQLTSLAESITTCNNEVINFHYFLASSTFLYPITRRHCFTLEYESNSFAHDLAFQLHGKAEQKMEPQRERDKYIKQTKKLLFIISFVQPCLMLFFLSQNTNVGSSSLHLSLISSVGSKDNC